MTTASGEGKADPNLDILRNLDILCVGETMAMVTPADGLPLRSSEECLLGIGGAESNVACQLAEMGFTAGWASRVGNDPFGSRILDELGRRHVDVSWVAKDQAAPTGVYFKDPDAGQGAGTYYYRSGSAASALDVASAAGWPLENTGWVHLTGILPALSATCAELAEYLLLHGRERPFNVSFDVNYRPALWPVAEAGPRLLELANLAHTVLVGLDEAQALWGCGTAEEVAALLPGASHVVVKDSALEAVEFVRREGLPATVCRVPANRVEVVEPVGAGDAFAAGYLAGLLRGDPPEERLALGHSLAAWTLGTRADFRPGHGPAPRSFAV